MDQELSFDNVGGLLDWAGSKLVSEVQDVLQGRRKYWAEQPETEWPTPDRVDDMISTYSNQALAVSLIAAFPGGLLGYATILPELALTLLRQTKMTYDIAFAHGHEEKMMPELALHLLATGVGGVGTVLVVRSAERFLVRRASLRTLQSLARTLAWKTTQRTLSRGVSRLLPMVGMVAVGLWSREQTKRIGKRADEIFRVGIVIDSAEVDEEQNGETTTVENERKEAERFKLFINLLRVDGSLSEIEKQLLTRLAGERGISAAELGSVLKLADEKKLSDVDYKLAASTPEEASSTLLSMVALARIDKKVHNAERRYIERVMEQLPLEEDDRTELRELLDQEFTA